MTAAEYRDTPLGPPWFQLIDGLLIQEPSPTDGHQRCVGNLYLVLAHWARQSGCGVVRIAPLDVWLSEKDVVQPDIFFVSSESQERLRSDGLHGAPDLAVEVLSPSNATLDLTKKRALYERTGAKELWLIDPVNKRLTTERFAAPSSPQTTVHSVGDTFSSPLLPGLAIPVAEIFRA